MGANTSERIYDYSLGRDKVAKLWKEDVEMSLHEDGHSYSGEIGMLGTKIAAWHDLNFSDTNGAYNFIAEKHQKWSAGIAVSAQHDGKKVWVIGGWCAS